MSFLYCAPGNPRSKMDFTLLKPKCQQSCSLPWAPDAMSLSASRTHPLSLAHSPALSAKSHGSIFNLPTPGSSASLFWIYSQGFFGNSHNLKEFLHSQDFDHNQICEIPIAL